MVRGSERPKMEPQTEIPVSVCVFVCACVCLLGVVSLFTPKLKHRLRIKITNTKQGFSHEKR